MTFKFNRPTSIEDAAGKTVRLFLDSFDGALVVFDDGTYVHIGIDSGYNGDCPSIEINCHKADDLLGDYGAELEKAGLLPAGAMEARRAAKDAAAAADRERNERVQYERLRAKFGS